MYVYFVTINDQSLKTNLSFKKITTILLVCEVVVERSKKRRRRDKRQNQRLYTSSTHPTLFYGDWGGPVSVLSRSLQDWLNLGPI